MSFCPSECQLVLTLCVLMSHDCFPASNSGKDQETHSDQVQDASAELGRTEAESDQRNRLQ